MIIGFVGRMRSGKTLTMSALAYAMHEQQDIPIYANYDLKCSKRIEKVKELWNLNHCIVAFDEIHNTIDSRRFKENVELTHWITQTGKKQIIVMFTSQHIGQIDLRIRQNCDILVWCEKKNENFFVTFIDYQYGDIGKKALLANPEAIYPLYNTYEAVKGLDRT